MSNLLKKSVYLCESTEMRNILDVNFFAAEVGHYQPNTWRGRDGSSVLVAKAAHACSFGLLFNDEPKISKAK